MKKPSWEKIGNTLALVSALGLFSSSALPQTQPVLNARYQNVHNQMLNYINTTPATAAVLQIREYDTSGGVTVVLNQGYGVLQNGAPTPVNALFRTASLAKSLTALAAKRLVENNMLSWNTRVFCEPGETSNPASATGCVIPPQGGGFVHAGHYDLTVLHLLTHRSGVNNPSERDVIDGLAARGISVPMPPSIIDYITFLQGVDLDFTPCNLEDDADTAHSGAGHSDILDDDGRVIVGPNYSNMGFDLLGHVIAIASNPNNSIPSADRYVQYIQSIAADFGVNASDIQLAGAEVSMRVQGREPEYIGDMGFCESLFTPGSWVHHQNGCGLYGQKPGAGGLVVTTGALLNIMQHHWFETHLRPRPTRPIIEESYRVLDRENGYFSFWAEQPATGGGWGTLSRARQNVHAEDPQNSDPRADVVFLSNFHAPGTDSSFEDNILPGISTALAAYNNLTVSCELGEHGVSNGGFGIYNASVTNTGVNTLSGWSVAIDFQSATPAPGWHWPSGNISVTVVDNSIVVSGNGALAPNQTLNFGVGGNYSGSTPQSITCL